MNLLSNCIKGFRPPRCQVEYLGPLHTRDWEPVTITLQTLSLVGKAKFYQVCFMICWRDQRSEWMQDGCNIYIDSYMASNGWSFLSTWTIVDNRLLETKKLGRPWHSECPQPLIYSIMIMCENPHEQNFIEMAFGWGPGQVWLHAILEVPWPHEMSLGRPLNTFFWALTISWSRLLACVQSGPYSEARTTLNYQEKVQREKKEKRFMTLKEERISQGARWHHAKENPSIYYHCHCALIACIGTAPSPKFLTLFRETKLLGRLQLLSSLYLLHL